MAKHKDIWICLLFLLYPPIELFLLGELKWALISLGLIPLFFICWGLSILLNDTKVREINKHMTESERKQFSELSKRYGRKVGFFFAMPIGVTFFILSYIFHIKNYTFYFGAFVVFLLVLIPFGLRHRKQIICFALSTRYAKDQGWDIKS